MNEIEIIPLATWEASVGILGNYNSPLVLQVDIKNNSGTVFTADTMCISVRKWFLFIPYSQDILEDRKQLLIAPRSSQSFKIDIMRLLQNHQNALFRVKITSNNRSYYSDTVSLATLRAIENRL